MADPHYTKSETLTIEPSPRMIVRASLRIEWQTLIIQKVKPSLSKPSLSNPNFRTW